MAMLDWMVCVYVGTLSVIAARELVLLGGSFPSHSTSVRRLRHLRGHASYERYAVSNVEGREINLQIILSGSQTRVAILVTERSIHYTIAPLLCKSIVSATTHVWSLISVTSCELDPCAERAGSMTS